MCGRYSQARTKAEIELEWGEVRIKLKKPRFNIAPGQFAPVIRLDDGKPRVDDMAWGLIPGWAKDAKIAFQCINARSETVADKPAYRSAFKSRRCLIPADGFYEWLPRGKVKLPYRFVRPTGGSFVFAGLWESWQPPEAADPLATFTIITTTPNADVAPIHDRMPVVFDSSAASRWLHPDLGKEELLSLLKPANDVFFNRVPVNPVVNNARDDVPECIEKAPLTEQF